MSTQFKLYMFHGRVNPDEQLEDWGFEGPTLDGIIGFHNTYLTTYRVKFVDKASYDKALTITGWNTWADASDLMLELQFTGDMLYTVANGESKYYGDWGFTV